MKGGKGREGSELNALVCANYHSIKQFCTMDVDTCPTYPVGYRGSSTIPLPVHPYLLTLLVVPLADCRLFDPSNSPILYYLSVSLPSTTLSSILSKENSIFLKTRSLGVCSRLSSIIERFYRSIDERKTKGTLERDSIKRGRNTRQLYEHLGSWNLDI